MRTIKIAALIICGAFTMSFITLPAKQNAEQISQNLSSVKWKATVVELGEIPVGKPVTIEFEFTNTGKEDVIITEARPGCGCTVADYPKQPIAAGKTAKIVATFNAAAKGIFDKHVNVTFQNEEPVVLSFKGTVI